MVVRAVVKWLSFLLSLFGFLAGASSVHAAVRPFDAAGLEKLRREDAKELFILDVRTPREYAEGRIPTAVLIPMNEIPERLSEIPRNKKVVVVCASGARSAAVARYLDQVGYPWVANYAGGVLDWARRGLPLAQR